MAEGYQVENPVTRTRGIVQIEQHATPETQLLHGRMKVMEEQIDQLRASVGTLSDGTLITGNTIAWGPVGITGHEQGMVLDVTLDPKVPDAPSAIEEWLQGHGIAYGYKTTADKMTIRIKKASRVTLVLAINQMRTIPGVTGIITSRS